MTYYEKIKNMSVDELALFMDKIQTCCMFYGCRDCPIHEMNPMPHYYCSLQDIKSWLKSKVGT